MIDEFLAAPERFEVADSGDPYWRLRLLEKDDLSRWSEKRQQRIAASDGLVAVRDEKGLAAFATLRPLEADSDAFGVAIGSIDVLAVRNGTVSAKIARFAQLLDEIRSRHGTWGDLLTSLIDLDRPVVNEALQTAGARVAGGNFTWACALTELDPSLMERPSPFREEWLAPDQMPELLDAVAAAYGTYRSHYHADSRLANADCARPYVLAIERHVHEGGDVALLRSSDGALIGFSTLNPHVDFNTSVGCDSVAEIAISGVVPTSRERGVYEASLVQGLRRFRADGFGHVVFGCTADNFAVQSTWIRIGRFRPRRFCFRLHWWPGG